jgi:hypothetical protein
MSDPAEKITEKGVIWARLNKVLAEVEGVKKRGHNNFHNYDYVMEADLTDAIRPLMAKHGLSMTFGTGELRELASGVLAVQCRITLGDIDGNEMIVEMWGTGQDKGDKALYKAYTGAVKYFLYKTFMISTNDDPEKDGKDEGKGAGKPPAAAPPKAGAPPSAKAPPPVKKTGEFDVAAVASYDSKKKPGTKAFQVTLKGDKGAIITKTDNAAVAQAADAARMAKRRVTASYEVYKDAALLVSVVAVTGAPMGPTAAPPPEEPGDAQEPTVDI